MRCGFSERSKKPAKWRSVKSGPKLRVGNTTDAHRRGNNFLDDVEKDRLRARSAAGMALRERGSRVHPDLLRNATMALAGANKLG
jgi:hypothetical protein